MNMRRISGVFALAWICLAAWIGWQVYERGEVLSALAGAFILYGLRTAILEMLDSYFPRNFGDEQ